MSRGGGEPRDWGGPYLTIVVNHTEVQRKPLVATTTLGRSLDCDIWIEDPQLSRRHCQLEEALEGDGWVVTDLGSRNGTYVNARKTEGRTPLNHGDVITIGKVHVKFRARGYVPPRPASPEEAIKMSPNRAAMKVRNGSSSTRPLPTPSPKISNADTISPGDSAAGAKPLPFTRPPARPIVKESEEDDV